MIASPTAASAAATAIVKSTNPSPYIVLVSRANATRLRLTAFIISSTHMNMMIRLRRTRTPISPITKRAALRKRKWLVVSSVIAVPRLPTPDPRVEIWIPDQDDLACCLELPGGLLVCPSDRGRCGWPLRQRQVGAARMPERDRSETLPEPLGQGEDDGSHDPNQEHQRDDLKGEQVLGEQDIAEGLGAAADEQDILRCRIACRATYGPVGDRRRHLEEQNDTQQRTDDSLHRVPTASLGKFLRIDEHEEEEHQHQHSAGIDDHLSGGQEFRSQHDEDACCIEQRQHQKDGGMDRIPDSDHPDSREHRDDAKQVEEECVPGHPAAPPVRPQKLSWPLPMSRMSAVIMMLTSTSGSSTFQAIPIN